MSDRVSIPHVTVAHWPTIKADRFAASIRADSPEGCSLALLGLPYDLGIKLNGGRPGAAAGPAAFRAALASFGTPWDGLRAAPLSVKIFDAGDIQPAAGENESALHETHARVEGAILELHKMGLLPVCVGGGHDLTLPTVTALARHVDAAVGGINFDAHLDVRERIGSGMAFRKLIDGKRLNPQRFVEVGLGRFVNDESDLNWLSKQGAKLIFADGLIDIAMPVRQLLDIACVDAAPGFVSIDLDGIDSAEAPGVSALNPLGLHVHHAAALAEAAGATPEVRHFDIMELSPQFDPSGHTARIAALLFLSFVAGFGARPR
jgi:formiminoglutamase